MADIKFTNKEVVLILKEVLAAMEVKGDNIFKIRAYQNAVSIIDNLTVSIQDMWSNKRLDEIPGIGVALSDHLNELFTTGKVVEFDKAKSGLPEGMFALIGLRGIGAKKAFKLANAFKLVSRDDAIEKIKEFAEQGRIRELEGFGEKSEKDILEAVAQAKMTKNEKPRMLYTAAEEIVNRIFEHMKQLDCIELIEATGSFRRKQPTIGDLDIVAATPKPELVIEHFLKFPEIGEVLVKGEKKASCVLKNDVQVDIRVSEPEAVGAMLQYSTGSKQHNIDLRNFALDKRVSLSEYGIKKGEKILEFADETSFYKYLGLPYIPPELRQGNVEIGRALKGELPELIELKDIKGDIHTHTTDSDGLNTLEEMVETARSLGYEYYGVADHSHSVQARGYDEVKRLMLEKRKKIDELNSKSKDIKILYGAEVNILADGTLGLPNDLLEILDYTIGGLHTSFNQDKEKITQRFLAALENPLVDIIAHPTARLINERSPVEADWAKIFAAARDNNKVLEINGQPNRLDLPNDLVFEAIKWGVKLIINTDAHSTDTFSFMRYGINNARRGWATKANIINTLPYSEFIKYLHGMR